MTEYLVYLVIGKLLIFMCQTAGILEPVWSLLRTLEMRLRGRFMFWPANHDLVDEFRECGFCIGCYIFPVLCLYYRVNVIGIFPDGVVSYILSGFVSSFIIHLFSGGCKYWFGERL